MEDGQHAAAFGRDEYRRRLAAVERALATAGLDALVAYAAGHRPGPVAYLTGYEPAFGLHDVAYCVVLPGQDPTLLANGFWDQPATRVWFDDVRITSDFGAALHGLLAPSVRRVGIAGMAFFPAPVYAALSDFDLTDATRLLKEVACIKSDPEIDVLRQCARMSEAGGRAFLAGIDAGMDERELQQVVEHSILRAGADRLAFPTLLFSGESVPTGIGFARRRAVRVGEQVNVVCGATLRGYRTEVGRVTTVGAPSTDARRVMDAAAEMHAAMLEATRPGRPVHEIAAAAVRVATQHGLQDYLYRSAAAGPGYGGHGMGCWYSELPDINTDVQDIVQAGMLLILEARLGIPGVAGATITDPVAVSARGAERLVDLPIRTWA